MRISELVWQGTLCLAFLSLRSASSKSDAAYFLVTGCCHREVSGIRLGDKPLSSLRYCSNWCWQKAEHERLEMHPFRAPVLAVQKVLSGSGRARRLRLMGKYIGHRLVARPQPDNTFCSDSTLVTQVDFFPIIGTSGSRRNPESAKNSLRAPRRESSTSRRRRRAYRKCKSEQILLEANRNFYTKIISFYSFMGKFVDCGRRKWQRNSDVRIWPLN